MMGPHGSAAGGKKKFVVLLVYPSKRWKSAEDAIPHVEEQKSSMNSQLPFKAVSDSKIIHLQYAAADSPWRKEDATRQGLPAGIGAQIY